MSEGTDPLRYFRIEAREISEALARALLELEKAPSPDAVARMLRLAHTLKGAAGVVKQRAIAERAHALEDALAPFRDRATLSADEAGGLLAHVDAIAALVTGLDKPPPQRNHAATPVSAIGADAREMDTLLDSITEAGARMRGLRGASGLALKVRRLSERLAERAALLPAAQQSGGSVFALTSELRAAAGMLEQALSSGLDLAEREIQQARMSVDRLRLLPAATMLTALERAARDIAQAGGKLIRFEPRGGEIRLDAQVLAIVQQALVQMVRNAVAHGIELPDARARAGKPAAGHIELTIARRGNKVIFTCRDDGSGVDLEAVRRAARTRGLAAAGQEELLQMLFESGFSTAGAVTEISGRGVGLDVVRDAAARLGGKVTARSDTGKGTSIEIMVPATLSALEALLVESEGAVSAIPLGMVQAATRLTGDVIVAADDGDRIVHDGRMLPLISLAALLAGATRPRPASGAAVIVAGTPTPVAFHVDRLLGASDIVVRPLPAHALADAMVAGLSPDAEGVPRLVLDAEGLVAAAAGAAGLAQTLDDSPQAPILVIDDSLTTRVLEQSILESAGYEVDLAVSAEEGLAKARQRRYGLFLVDVEMPGMDGFGFIQAIRADPLLRTIPAILVTSRDAPEDQRRGQEAGANGYVVKGDFDQNQVLASIRRLLEQA